MRRFGDKFARKRFDLESHFYFNRNDPVLLEHHYAAATNTAPAIAFIALRNKFHTLPGKR